MEIQFLAITTHVHDKLCLIKSFCGGKFENAIEVSKRKKLSLYIGERANEQAFVILSRKKTPTKAQMVNSLLTILYRGAFFDY